MKFLVFQFKLFVPVKLTFLCSSNFLRSGARNFTGAQEILRAQEVWTETQEISPKRKKFDRHKKFELLVFQFRLLALRWNFLHFRKISCIPVKYIALVKFLALRWNFLCFSSNSLRPSNFLRLSNFLRSAEMSCTGAQEIWWAQKVNLTGTKSLNWNTRDFTGAQEI